MKKLLLVLAACLALGATGCYVEDGIYAPPPGVYSVGTVEFCDDYGCRMVAAPYYYVDGQVVYYDAHFGVWIGPHSYYRSGVWYHHPIEGYREHYHSGYYHRTFTPPVRSGIPEHWHQSRRR